MREHAPAERLLPSDSQVLRDVLVIVPGESREHVRSSPVTASRRAIGAWPSGVDMHINRARTVRRRGKLRQVRVDRLDLVADLRGCQRITDRAAGVELAIELDEEIAS